MHVILFLGQERVSTADGCDFSSSAMNNTESSTVSRRYGSNRFSTKGRQIQRCPQSPRLNQFESDTCCDPVLAANMAALAFNINTSRYKLKRCVI